MAVLVLTIFFYGYALPLKSQFGAYFMQRFEFRSCNLCMILISIQTHVNTME